MTDFTKLLNAINELRSEVVLLQTESLAKDAADQLHRMNAQLELASFTPFKASDRDCSYSTCSENGDRIQKIDICAGSTTRSFDLHEKNSAYKTQKGVNMEITGNTLTVYIDPKKMNGNNW